MNYDELAKEIYEWNTSVGWWDAPDRCVYQTIQLVCTEVAEATEGERRNRWDNHLPHRMQGEVELADALIRTLDIGGRFGMPYDPTSVCHKWCAPEGSIGKQHLGLIAATVSVATEYGWWRDSTQDGTLDLWDRGYSLELQQAYSVLINSIVKVAHTQKYNLEGALVEKVEYNKTRLDPKQEARAEFGGKEF